MSERKECLNGCSLAQQNLAEIYELKGWTENFKEDMAIKFSELEKKLESQIGIFPLQHKLTGMERIDKNEKGLNIIKQELSELKDVLRELLNNLIDYAHDFVPTRDDMSTTLYADLTLLKNKLDGDSIKKGDTVEVTGSDIKGDDS